MDALRKIFPLSFKENKDNALIVSIIIYVVALVVGSLLLTVINSLVWFIPVVGYVIGIICYILGTIIDLYAVIGIVLAALVMAKVIK